MVKQQRATRTRQALLHAAAEVFAQDGFVSASLTSVSKRAGVSNGALYFHFESKQALADAVEEEAAAVLQGIMEAHAAHADPLQRLVYAIYDLMGHLDRDAVVRAGFELGGRVTHQGGACDLRGLLRTWVEQVLAEAERDGDLADGVSAFSASVTVVAATVGFLQLGARDRAWLSDRALSQFWGLLLPRLASSGALRQLVSERSTGRVSPR
ncbi:ScbR family autoregulator-binding transcription factor [[Kitasatospora] papulosa]|uniref:ScbR family autoregulator-binding transcription factor n=1 Tax=[Kitasatospora] papulosa TaxID=1464011 RepID=UPI0036B68A59